MKPSPLDEKGKRRPRVILLAADIRLESPARLCGRESFRFARHRRGFDLELLVILVSVCVYLHFQKTRTISEILFLRPSELRRLLIVKNWRPVAGSVER